MLTVNRYSKLLFTLFLFITNTSYANDHYQMLEHRLESALAVGWNTLSNDVSTGRATCLDPDSYQSNPTQHKSASYTGSFRLVYSSSDIEDGFGLNASASYRGIVYNASGSVKYAQSKQLSVASTNVSGFVTVETRADSILGKTGEASNKLDFIPSDVALPPEAIAARTGGIALAPDMADLLKSDAKEFFRQCGDGFVSDIYYGGRLNMLATLSTQSEASKKKLEASLKGGGGGADVSVGGFVSTVKNAKDTTFSASYLAVGSDGKGLSLSGIDEMKATIDEFPGAVFENDAGVRIRVMSYAAILPASEGYRFGVADDAIKAGRLYNELTSIWHTLGQILDGDAAPVAWQWGRSVGKECIAAKQDELIGINTSISDALHACATDTVSSMKTPSSCDSSTLLAGAKFKPDDPSCPATTQLVNNRLSAFDYRLFFPALQVPGKIDSCTQPTTAVVRNVMAAEWIKPAWDAKCSDPNQHPELCRNSTYNRLVKNIHVVDRDKPPLPSGGYRRSCTVAKCNLEWDANGKGKMQCPCSAAGKTKNTNWIVLQCPQKKALQNCRRTLKYGSC